MLAAVEAAQPADPHVAQPRVHDLEAVPVAGTGQARAGIQGEVRKVQPGEEDTEFMSKIFIPFFFLHTFFFAKHRFVLAVFSFLTANEDEGEK